MPGKSRITLLYAAQTPQTTITIALDTAFLEGLSPGEQAATGIYMMDNRHNLGSTCEGAQNLSTVCYTGDNISWTAVPVDPERGDTVCISGFTILTGNVFGGSIGNPVKSVNNPAYWIGRAHTGHSQSAYRIYFLIIDQDGNLFTANCIADINTI